MNEPTPKRGATGIVLAVIHSLLIVAYAVFFGLFLIDYIPNPQPIGLVTFLLVFLVYGSIAPAVFGIVEIIRAATHRIHRKAEWITYIILLVLYIGTIATFFALSQMNATPAA